MAKDKDNGCELFKLSSIFCSIKTKSGLTSKIFFNIDSYLFFSFYADYPFFEGKEKLCTLSKRKWIEKILKYQKLKNEDIFNCQYHYLNPEKITMEDILEILKYYKII